MHFAVLETNTRYSYCSVVVFVKQWTVKSAKLSTIATVIAVQTAAMRSTCLLWHQILKIRSKLCFSEGEVELWWRRNLEMNLDDINQLSVIKRHVDYIVLSRDVNETLRSETETRPRPRPSHFSRDRDRDRDIRFWVRDETETETSIGRDRDIFRDLGKLARWRSIFALHKCFF